MAAQPPTGIETASTPGAVPAGGAGRDAAQVLVLPGQHIRLTQVQLQDQTDVHNELVTERHWLLHPSERELRLSGNLFVVEDLFPRAGWILVRQAPLPHARPERAEADLVVRPRKGTGFDLQLLDDGAGAWAVLPYQGDAIERTRVLHAWQQDQRPATDAHRLPRFLTNTWGDRSRDSRIRQDFLEREIRAARRLGADVVQIDDGWQRGATANSAEARQRGGVWEGFWNADPHFWTPHPERLPKGLEPLLARARAAGLELGLWFAPDSWQDFANWRRDADCLLDFYRRLGIRFFKVDGVQARTPAAHQNLRRFFDAVLKESAGGIALDLDITAQVRPGYFGALDVGPLFVENRYTDWHNYWPHHTFRNLWKLAPWVAPSRLRLEFLNASRNTNLYPEDPLAPGRYTPDTLFATVMFAKPLGWFEASNLPKTYFEALPPLVRAWKACRRELFEGVILPLGAEPDGLSWSGLLSLSPDRTAGYALLFRPLGPARRRLVPAPGLADGDYGCERLTGQGACRIRDRAFDVDIPEPLGYVFVRFKRSPIHHRLENRRISNKERRTPMTEGTRHGNHARPRRSPGPAPRVHRQRLADQTRPGRRGRHAPPGPKAGRG